MIAAIDAFKLWSHTRTIVGVTVLLYAVGFTFSAAHAVPRRLWKINVDGTGLALFSGAEDHRSGSPQWSPDGKFVAFDSRPDDNDDVGRSVQIAVVRADGSDLRYLGHGAMPSWSPDGSQITCHTNDPFTTIVMNADGTGREIIAEHWGCPRWTRLNSHIALIHDSTLVLYDPVTGHERAILPRESDVNYGFSVSPDGHKFCFGANRGGLHIATLDELTMRSTVRTIVADGSYHHSSWSPNGKRIVFSKPLPQLPKPKTPKNSLLHTIDVDGKSPPIVIPGQEKDFVKYNCDPTWSPDGKVIIFAREPSDP